MYQTTIKCKSLRLAERYNNEVYNEAKGRIEREDVEEYVEASFESNTDKTHFYLNIPTTLLVGNGDIKIGDELIVTFSRVEK